MSLVSEESLVWPRLAEYDCSGLFCLLSFNCYSFADQFFKKHCTKYGLISPFFIHSTSCHLPCGLFGWWCSSDTWWHVTLPALALWQCQSQAFWSKGHLQARMPHYNFPGSLLCFWKFWRSKGKDEVQVIVRPSPRPPAPIYKSRFDFMHLSVAAPNPFILITVLYLSWGWKAEISICLVFHVLGGKDD